VGAQKNMKNEKLSPNTENVVLKTEMQSCFELMMGYETNNPHRRRRNETEFNKIFKDAGGWEAVLPGVSEIESPIGYTLRRENSSEMNGAKWTYADVNAHFGKMFPTWEKLPEKMEEIG